MPKITPTVFARVPIRPAFWITALALVAAALKITIALNTFGTNDVAAFYMFARSLADHGLDYLRLTQWPQFNGAGAFNLPWAPAAIVFSLKVGIIAAVLMIAWRRRYLPGRTVIDSIAYAWIIFFIFAPGIAVQYMVWLAPFVLILSPTFFGWLAASSSLCLFFFYDVTAGEFPRYVAISTDKLNPIWTPRSFWPWATLIIGMIIFWKRSTHSDPSFRLFTLEAVRAESPA